MVHLERECKRSGFLPKKLLLAFKLYHAAYLLHIYPELTLKKIANLCQFADEYHFCKCFKQATGVTAGAFRCSYSWWKFVGLLQQSKD